MTDNNDLGSGASDSALSVRSNRFGITDRGEIVDAFTMGRRGGIEVSVIAYGATVQSLLAPDRRGHRANVVLGFADLAGYQAVNSAYLGATVGRYANRIAEGRFVLDGHEFQLSRNEGRHHLHGGSSGLDARVWERRPDISDGEVSVTFSYTSASGDEGYPGALDVAVTYALTHENTLAIRYRAKSDASTVVNLTNHSLFNLAGGGTILDHELELNADAYTPVDSEMIPTGEIASVRGTPMDFRSPRRIGERIDAPFDQLTIGRGYDHNYVLAAAASDAPAFAARLRDPRSGRTMEVWTTEPGLQLYTGNRLDGTLSGFGGVAYERFAGLALETQKYPDSPNHPHFPAAVLRPGELYESTTELRLGVSDALGRHERDHSPAQPNVERPW